jgi:hypothetical protein
MALLAVSPEKQWVLQQMVFGAALEDLEKEFAALSVRFMPIKGAYLIAAGLAERMRARKMLDLDLLLLPEDFEKATRHFSHHPHTRPDRNYWPFEMSFTYETAGAAVYVELHRRLNYPQRFLLPAHDLFSRGTNTGIAQVIPCPEDALLILVCHSLVHIAYEMRGTIFEEVSLISGQTGFSWGRFWELAGSTGIVEYAGMLLARYAKVCKRDIPLPKPGLRARVLSPMIRPGVYRRLPVMVRKVMLEMAFVRDRWGLIKGKFARDRALSLRLLNARPNTVRRPRRS